MFADTGTRVLTHVLQQLPLVLQERPVVPPPGDALRTADVQIHRVTVALRHLGRLHKRVHIIGAELKHSK